VSDPPAHRRGLLGHAAIYAVAQLATAAASVLLLPIYTARLPPSDFGLIAILELGVTVLAGLIGTSVGSATMRLHFRPEHAATQHRLWTTGLLAIAAQGVVLLAVGWLARRPLARALFGSEVAGGESGAILVSAMLVTTLALAIANYGFTYLRAQRRSLTFMWVALGGLVLRIVINLWLLVGLGLGVAGYLAGGIVASGAQVIVLAALLFRGQPLRFVPSIGHALATFAGPIAVAGLAALAMHQADLWLLRGLLGDLGQIGLYAFAYALVQRSNGLLLTPFVSIWSARQYELARTPSRLEAYHRAFRGYTLVSGTALLGLALCAEPIVELVAGAAYLPAAKLMPMLCIGFFLFSLHTFFAAPALLAGRSGMIARNAVTAAAVNVALCLVLIPVAGIRGAAIASVAAYALYSLGGHLGYRRLDDLRYPLLHLVKLGVLGVAAWWTLPLLPLRPASPWTELVVAAAWGLLAGAIALLAWGRDLIPVLAYAGRDVFRRASTPRGAASSS
jgi:O-antigen/teichoic acid export membrane protein